MGIRLGWFDSMRRSHLPIAGILAILLAACAARPDVAVTVPSHQRVDAIVTVAGQRVDTVLSSTSERSAFSGSVRDYAHKPPVTVVRAAAPVSIHVATGQGTTGVRGWIYDVVAPTPEGGPIENFTLPGGGGAHESRSIAPGRTYLVAINLAWSALATSGEATYVFQVRVEPP